MKRAGRGAVNELGRSRSMDLLGALYGLFFWISVILQSNFGLESTFI
jgi:hypothetical protein